MQIEKVHDFPQCPINDQIYEIIPDKSKIVSSTNRLFNKYPTRYISAVPRFAILKYSNPGDTVLDPFCGSGTTAIESMLQGRNAISIDIDPFARLLIKVKTTRYSLEDIEFLDNVIALIKRDSENISEDLYPLPNLQNIDKWFTKEAQRNLAFLKHCIITYANNNQNIKDFLLVAFAAILRKASNAEDVSPKPYVSTRYPKTPENAIDLFFKVVEMYRDAIIEFSSDVRNHACSSTILPSNDARTIGNVPLVDLAVTSPPYINAYDYVRSLRFEDVWLDLASESTLRKNRKAYIGSEVSNALNDNHIYVPQSKQLVEIINEISQVDVRRSKIVAAYFEDMARNMISVREALKKGGRYVIVVGDSMIRNTPIPTAKILTDIAIQNGYEFELSFKYVIRDRYLHLPRGNRGGIIKYDEILVLCKK